MIGHLKRYDSHFKTILEGKFQETEKRNTSAKLCTKSERESTSQLVSRGYTEGIRYKAVANVPPTKAKLLN